MKIVIVFFASFVFVIILFNANVKFIEFIPIFTPANIIFKDFKNPIIIPIVAPLLPIKNYLFGYRISILIMIFRIRFARYIRYSACLLIETLLLVFT